jgi:hypothetical protein
MSTYVRTQAIDHTVGEKGRVAIAIRSADVRIKGISGADAHVRATFEIQAASEADADRIFGEVQMRVQRRDGELSVDEREWNHSVGSVIGRLFGANGHYELTVEADVPTNVELQLTGVSSDVDATDLRGEQRYRTVSGDLSASRVGGSVQLESVSGDTTIRADEPLDAQAQSVSGDVSIITPTLRSLRATTVSGDVEIEGELARDGDFRVETISGDFVLGLLGSATIEVHGLSTDVNSELDHRLEGQVDRRRVIIGSGGPRLLFNSMSGDVDVRRPRRLRAPARSEQSAPASQLDVLRALERGEIDVDEATRRLTRGS